MNADHTRMKVTSVPITENHSHRPRAPADPTVIPALKANIEADGLRQPIEIAELGYRKDEFFAGLKACTDLGWASIPPRSFRLGRLNRAGCANCRTTPRN